MQLRKELQTKCVLKQNYNETVKDVIESICKQENVESKTDGTDFNVILTTFESAITTLEAAEQNDVFFGERSK